MSELQVYTFPDSGNDVRTVMVDGEPWFVAADVCSVLGITNPRQAITSLDPDEVLQAPVTTNDGSGRVLPTNLVSEAGLYSLILRSRKPEAKAFKRWVTHEVLPAIRRTGSYALAAGAEHQLPQSYADALRELAATVEREQQAVRQRDHARVELDAVAPRAESWDAMAAAAGDFSVREAAQILSRDPAITTGQNRLFKTLRELEWVDGKGKPYQRHVDVGRIVERVTTWEHPHSHEPRLDTQVRITVKGLQELHQTLGGQRPLFGGQS